MIRVKLFAMLRELAGVGEMEMPRPMPATVGGVSEALAMACPAVRETFSRRTVLAVLNGRYAGLDEAVQEGDEVAFLPPVSGG
jgi:molybdopterin synthase sulfur carrier subunit